MKKAFILLIIITLFSLCVNADGILDDGKNIYSDYVYMVNLNTGKVVYEYEADAVTFPASLTKIMTSILAIEKVSLDETVTIPSGIFDDVYKTGGAHISLKAGEKISVGDLVRATMIRSSCDTATALAWYISGSVEDFAILMNQKAKEIGCTSTNFTNAHGLHDDGHYTTAKDMFLIANYALQNELFCDIINEYSCTIPATNMSDERVLMSTIEIEIPENEAYYEHVTGIKSGFTDEAGRCLITKATKDGETYLLVTLGANRDKWYNSNMAFTDAVTLFEYCFAEYDIKTVVSSNTPLTEIEVSKGAIEKVSLYVDSDVVSLVALDDAPNLTFDLPKKAKAPLLPGDVVGKVTIDVGGETFTRSLIVKEEIEKTETLKGLKKFNDGNAVATFLDTVSIILFLIGAAIITVFVLKIQKENKK